MISTLMFTSPAKIKLSSWSSIHYWKTKSKYWVDCWELNFQKFEELDLTGFYCVIIYWYDWLQCTCSKLTQVQDIMRHGLTFKTSNKQLNRPSSAYRGIFRQIKHTYFIFFKHILFILRIKTTDPFFLVCQSMRTVHKHSSLTILFFLCMVQHSQKNVSTSYLKLINLNISI